jgi:hypothetical protein
VNFENKVIEMIKYKKQKDTNVGESEQNVRDMGHPDEHFRKRT